MKSLSHIFLAGLTLTVLAVATVSMWVLEPMATKQKFVVVPAIEKEIKIRVVSAIDYKTKVRPIAHVGRSVLSLRDQLEGSDSTPDVICMLRDGEWRERIHNTPCFDVGEQAMRFQRGEDTLVKITKSESNEIIGLCFSDEGRLFCKSHDSTRKIYVEL
ncbi:hypothetical protein N9Y91_08690 [Alphaproteobacteria bacterium]|nr:hypothetical protein [Alphaproteobacteria bacterium]